jgi:hypothetical protein
MPAFRRARVPKLVEFADLNKEQAHTRITQAGDLCQAETYLFIWAFRIDNVM